jgi:hypothetical protein
MFLDSDLLQIYRIYKALLNHQLIYHNNYIIYIYIYIHNHSLKPLFNQIRISYRIPISTIEIHPRPVSSSTHRHGFSWPEITSRGAPGEDHTPRPDIYVRHAKVPPVF